MQDLQSLSQNVNSRQFPLSWPGHWIDGQWLKANKTAQTQTKQSVNPNNGTVLCEFPVDKGAVDAAITAAAASRERIAKLSLAERLNVLQQVRRGLADYERLFRTIMQVEAGKPAWEAQADFDAAVRYLDTVIAQGEGIFDSILAPAKLGRHTGEFRMWPVGVTAAYLPFSTPLTSFAFYFCASVIAGCPLVLVTSTHATLTGLAAALIDQTFGLTQGLLSVVFGNFNVFKHAVTDRRVAAILYTGSSEHCDFIRQESRSINGRQTVLQSGGKNAVLLHSSGDIETALKCTTYGALKSAGQLCTSTSRVFVHKSLTKTFEDRLFNLFQKIHIGPTDQASDVVGDPFMGPLYSRKAVEKFLRYQTMAHREAEHSVQWGKSLETNSKGFFVRPGIHKMREFSVESAYQSNVLFCPDVAIYEYEALETAIDCINATSATMAVSFVGDPEVLKSRRALFHAPNLLCNLPTVEIEATLPLAGRLHSGGNRFHGPGIALYLCYPQVVQFDLKAQNLLSSWPWPKT